MKKNIIKKKLATRVRTTEEIKDRISIFDTKAWRRIEEGTRERVANRIKKAKERKAERDATPKVAAKMKAKRLKKAKVTQERQNKRRLKNLKNLKKK